MSYFNDKDELNKYLKGAFGRFKKKHCKLLENKKYKIRFDDKPEGFFIGVELEYGSDVCDSFIEYFKKNSDQFENYDEFKELIRTLNWE